MLFKSAVYSLKALGKSFFCCHLVEIKMNAILLLLLLSVALTINADDTLDTSSIRPHRHAKASKAKTTKNGKSTEEDETPPDGAAGCLYVGTSEKKYGAKIQQLCFDEYGNKVSGPMNFDESGDATKSYSTSFAYQADSSNPNVFYSSLKNGILWQCSKETANSCGTWETVINAWATSMIFGPPDVMYAGLARNSFMWKCPMQASNQCQTINIGYTVLSLAYDEDSQTVYAGVGVNPGAGVMIYKIDSNNNVSEFASIPTGGVSTVNVNNLELVGNILWVSYATVTADCGLEGICTGGGIIYCDITSGSCHFIIGNKPFWGITYSPDQNMVYAEQVSFQSIGSTSGYIYWFNPSSPSNYGIYVGLGEMGNGFVADDLSNPAFPPNAFQYGGGYLWIGTGTCKDSSCSSVFQCPAEGTPISMSSCTKLWRLNCNKSTNVEGTCLGAQSLIYIEN